MKAQRETRVGQPASWGEALLGALPFLLFGLAYLVEAAAELAGHGDPAFTLLDGSLNRPALILTAPQGVFFATFLGLLFGAWKSFPRWSFSYLGMSLFFSWSYNQQLYYGVLHKWWVWLPSIGAILLSLLLARSLQPFGSLLRGAWSDWTRLSLAIYAFALPMLTVIFFDGDWGAAQLYGLVFDTVLLAAGAAAFLRARTIVYRLVSLQAPVLVLTFKGLLGGWFSGHLNLRFGPAVFFLSLYCGILLLPAVIGLLRRGTEALSAR